MHKEDRGARNRASSAEERQLKFIKRVKERHGDKVDCSQTVFVDMSTSVSVSCYIHGIYQAKPRTLLECGTGCKECAKEARLAPRAKQMQEMLISGKKRCSKCHQVKTHSEFAKTKDKASGMISHCKTCVNSKNKKLWEEGSVRDAVYRRKYGISLKQYEFLFEEQAGLCKICGTDDPRGHGSKNGRFFVDHCHDTGKVRGLLCHHCNIGIGAFRDDTVKLSKAIQYLVQAGPSFNCCTSGGFGQNRNLGATLN